MKRAMLLLLLAIVVGSSTGCCLLDRLFYYRRGYPLGQGGNPGCQSCGTEGCNGPQCAGCGRRTPGCSQCGSGGCGPGGCGAGDESFYNDGSGGSVAYPYYTNRGPRDFLSSDPRGIGPGY